MTVLDRDESPDVKFLCSKRHSDVTSQQLSSFSTDNHETNLPLNQSDTKRTEVNFVQDYKN